MLRPLLLLVAFSNLAQAHNSILRGPENDWVSTLILRTSKYSFLEELTKSLEEVVQQSFSNYGLTTDFTKNNDNNNAAEEDDDYLLAYLGDDEKTLLKYMVSTIPSDIALPENVTLEIVLRTLASLTPVINVNKSCSDASWTYLWNLAMTQQLWAIGFFDASGKLPDGIFSGTKDFCRVIQQGSYGEVQCGKMGYSFLENLIQIPVGNTYAIGSFEECLMSRSALVQNNDALNPLKVKQDFKGRYVPVRVVPSEDVVRSSNARMASGIAAGTILPPIFGPIINQIFNATGTTDLNDVVSAIQAVYAITLNFNYGICIPDVCTPEDVMENNRLLYQSLKIKTELGLDGKSYTEDNKREAIGSYEKGIISFFALIAFLMLIGTLVECWQLLNPFPISDSIKEDHMVLRILKAFSIYANGRQVLNTESGSGYLNCLNGMRFISMSWIILGHLYMVTNLYPSENRWKIESIAIGRESWLYEVILNAVISVDTFFFMSGTLVAYLSFSQLAKQRFSIVLFYVHRIIRLWFPLAITVAFMAGIPHLMSYGPNFGLMKEQSLLCQNNGWRNLLFINNFWDNAESCIAQTWYLACDMQLYILSPLLILPIWKSPKIGLLWAGTVYVAFTSLIGYFVLHYDVPPDVNILQGRAAFGWDYGVHYYNMPYVRFQPYLIGIVFGYILFKTKGKEIRIPHALNFLMWQVSLLTMFGVLFGLATIRRESDFGAPAWSPFESVIYNCFSKTAWSLALAWVVFSCHNGYGGIINSFLSWKAFIPLSRLTFCAYFNHIHVILLVILQMTTPLYFTDFFISQLFIGILCFVFSASFVHTLVAEIPIANLEKILLGGLFKPGGNQGKKESSVDEKKDLPTEEKKDLPTEEKKEMPVEEKIPE